MKKAILSLVLALAGLLPAFVNGAESQPVRAGVTVKGEVASPGFIASPRDGSFTLMSAIARAGSFTRLANPRYVVVKTKDGKETVYDLNDFVQKGKGTDVTVNDGDTIVVWKRGDPLPEPQTESKESKESTR